MLPFEFYQQYSQVALGYAGHPQPTYVAANPPGAPSATGDSGTAAGRRRSVLAALSVLLLAAAGVGGAVASGAFHGRTPATHTAAVAEHRHPAARARHLPPGPRWDTTTSLSTAKGVFTLTVHAAITHPAATTEDPATPSKALLTPAQMAGYYTLTNTATTSYDLAEPVRVFAYWAVPTGMCNRWNPLFTPDLIYNNIPVVPAGHGKELCPLAWGDSTLDSVPQSLAPGAAATLSITPTMLGGLGHNPLHTAAADAAVVAHVTAAAPDAWLAVNEELSTDPHHMVASSGLPQT